MVGLFGSQQVLAQEYPTTPPEKADEDADEEADEDTAVEQPPRATSQYQSAPLPQPLRTGFWASIGLGYGSLSCQDCDERLHGTSLTLSLGGSISSHLLLAGTTNAAVHVDDTASLSVGSTAFSARIYPDASDHYFINVGVGVGLISLEFETDIATIIAEEEGGSALLGGGYDFMVGDSWAVTALANWIFVVTENSDANFLQIGAAVTWH